MRDAAFGRVSFLAFLLCIGDSVSDSVAPKDPNVSIHSSQESDSISKSAPSNDGLSTRDVLLESNNVSSRSQLQLLAEENVAALDEKQENTASNKHDQITEYNSREPSEVNKNNGDHESRSATHSSAHTVGSMSLSTAQAVIDTGSQEEMVYSESESTQYNEGYSSMSPVKPGVAQTSPLQYGTGYSGGVTDLVNSPANVMNGFEYSLPSFSTQFPITSSSYSNPLAQSSGSGNVNPLNHVEFDFPFNPRFPVNSIQALPETAIKASNSRVNPYYPTYSHEYPISYQNAGPVSSSTYSPSYATDMSPHIVGFNYPSSNSAWSGDNNIKLTPEVSYSELSFPKSLAKVRDISGEAWGASQEDAVATASGTTTAIYTRHVPQNELVWLDKLPGAEDAIQCLREGELHNLWSPTHQCMVCACVREQATVRAACASCGECPATATPPPPGTIVPTPPQAQVSCDPLPWNQPFLNPLNPCQTCMCQLRGVDATMEPRITCQENYQCVLPPNSPVIPPLPVTPEPVPLPLCEKFPQNVLFPHPKESCKLCKCLVRLSSYGTPVDHILCLPSPDCEAIPTPKPFHEEEYPYTPGPYPLHPQPVYPEPYPFGPVVPELEPPAPPARPVPADPSALPAEASTTHNPVSTRITDDPLPWPPITPPPGALPGPPPHESCHPYPSGAPFDHPWDECQTCVCSEFHTGTVVNIEVDCHTKPSCCVELPRPTQQTPANSGELIILDEMCELRGLGVEFVSALNTCKICTCEVFGSYVVPSCRRTRTPHCFLQTVSSSNEQIVYLEPSCRHQPPYQPFQTNCNQCICQTIFNYVVAKCNPVINCDASSYSGGAYSYVEANVASEDHTSTPASRPATGQTHLPNSEYSVQRYVQPQAIVNPYSQLPIESQSSTTVEASGFTNEVKWGSPSSYSITPATWTTPTRVLASNDLSNINVEKQNSQSYSYQGPTADSVTQGESSYFEQQNPKAPLQHNPMLHYSGYAKSQATALDQSSYSPLLHSDKVNAYPILPEPYHKWSYESQAGAEAVQPGARYYPTFSSAKNQYYPTAYQNYGTQRESQFEAAAVASADINPSYYSTSAPQLYTVMNDVKQYSGNPGSSGGYQYLGYRPLKGSKGIGASELYPSTHSTLGFSMAPSSDTQLRWDTATGARAVPGSRRGQCQYDGDKYHHNCQACVCTRAPDGQLVAACFGNSCQ